MDSGAPVSLYLVLNPTNIQRPKPLVRLFLSQLIFILMPEMEFSSGQMKAPYKHRLLLLLDEFPALGKLGIFEQAIAYFSGWNIKAYLIFQDKAQLDAATARTRASPATVTSRWPTRPARWTRPSTCPTVWASRRSSRSRRACPSRAVLASLRRRAS